MADSPNEQHVYIHHDDPNTYEGACALAEGLVRAMLDVTKASDADPCQMLGLLATVAMVTMAELGHPQCASSTARLALAMVGAHLSAHPDTPTHPHEVN